MRHFYRTLVLAIIFCAVVNGAYAVPQVFNKNLSSSEQSTLDKGNVVIRKVKSPSALCIQSSNPYINRALSITKQLKPAYLAEVIQVRPYTEGEDFLGKFESLIMDIPSYEGIPYYSERGDAWYDLYSSAKVTSSRVNKNGSHTVFADLVMEPFGTINARIDTERTADSFYYISTNQNKLAYNNKYNCVNKEKMKSIIVIFREGNNWVLYGIGAVDAPSIFFLRDRVETSFMNRIKTFCTFFFEKLAE